MEKPKTGTKQAGKGGARDPVTGRFIKGNRSGGRRPIPKELVELLRSYTEEACRLLGETVTNEEAPLKERIACATEILDRVYGRPKQAVDVTGPEEGAFGVVILPEVKEDG